MKGQVYEDAEWNVEKVRGYFKEGMSTTLFSVDLFKFNTLSENRTQVFNIDKQIWKNSDFST